MFSVNISRPSTAYKPHLTKRRSITTGSGAADCASATDAIRVRENCVRDALAQTLNGKTEWLTPSGAIDVFTTNEVIEVKHFKNWKGGIGQILAYGSQYPMHRKRLHLYARAGENASKQFELATSVCSTNGVHVTFEEVSADGENMAINVLRGADVFGIRVAASTEPATGPATGLASGAASGAAPGPATGAGPGSASGAASGSSSGAASGSGTKTGGTAGAAGLVTGKRKRGQGGGPVKYNKIRYKKPQRYSTLFRER